MLYCPVSLSLSSLSAALRSLCRGTVVVVVLKRDAILQVVNDYCQKREVSPRRGSSQSLQLYSQHLPGTCAAASTPQIMVGVNSNYQGDLSACIHIDDQSLYKDGPCPPSNLKSIHGRLPWRAGSFKGPDAEHSGPAYEQIPCSQVHCRISDLNRSKQSSDQQCVVVKSDDASAGWPVVSNTYENREIELHEYLTSLFSILITFPTYVGPGCIGPAPSASFLRTS